MPGLRCKTVVCLGGCLNAMITPEFEEISKHAVIPLVSAGLIPEENMAEIVEIIAEFESESFTHAKQKEWELLAVGKIKVLLLV